MRGARGGARARARASAARRAGSAATGWRSAEWERSSRRPPRSTRSPATRPRCSSRRTTTRPGSTRRRSHAQTATSQVDGGVVERDAAGEPTGILREESAWQFRAPLSRCRPRTSSWRRRARAPASRASRGVVAIHDKDGWLGAPRHLPARRRARRADAARLAVGSVRAPAGARGARRPLGHRRRLPAHRLPEGVHGRDARLADRAGCSTARASRSRAARSSRRSSARRARRAGRSACTRSATARTARRSTRSRRRATLWAPLGLRHRIEHAQCLAPEDVGRFASTRRRLLGAVQPRALGPRPRRALLAGRRLDGAYAFRSLLGVGRGRRERL